MTADLPLREQKSRQSDYDGSDTEDIMNISLQMSSVDHAKAEPHLHNSANGDLLHRKVHPSPEPKTVHKSHSVPLNSQAIKVNGSHHVHSANELFDIQQQDQANRKDNQTIQSRVFGWFKALDRYEILSELLTPDSIKLTMLCLFWYTSSAVTNNIAKQIYNQVKCPVTLTYVQFGFVGIFCFLFGYFSSVIDHSRVSSDGLLGKTHVHQGSKLIIYKVPSLSLQNKFLKIPAQFVLTICTYMTSILVWASRSIAELFRFWIALGLGIHEEDFVANIHTKHVAASQLFRNTHIRLPTMDIFKTMAPLSLFLISGHVFGSVAISNVPVSFVHTIKALSPLFTVLIFRFVWKTRYQTNIYISLVPLTAGVMLACSFELSFNLIGLLCSLASTIIFVSQNIFSKFLFKGRKLDKLNMLLYSSSLSFIFMTPIWLWSEGHQLFGDDASDLQADSHRLSFQTFSNVSVWSLFILNGLSHFMQNVFAFSILSLVSPVTYSIASLIKRIVVIVASIIWFGQNVNWTQGVGICLTFTGLWMYQHSKHKNDGHEVAK